MKGFTTEQLRKRKEIIVYFQKEERSFHCEEEKLIRKAIRDVRAYAIQNKDYRIVEDCEDFLDMEYTSFFTNQCSPNEIITALRVCGYDVELSESVAPERPEHLMIPTLYTPEELQEFSVAVSRLETDILYFTNEVARIKRVIKERKQMLDEMRDKLNKGYELREAECETYSEGSSKLIFIEDCFVGHITTRKKDAE